jgi:hypothetical protein
MSQENVYVVIWKEDSPNPGHIEGTRYNESQLPVHNKDEVLGPHREFVQTIPGTSLHSLFVDPSSVTADSELWNVDLASCTWNWASNQLNLVYFPPTGWDDVRMARNNMLAASDNMFNEDTPDPLKSEWVEYRALLRGMIVREQAAGRTPDTVKWNDYLPPFPSSARIGVFDSEKASCAWYKGDNTYPPQAIIGSAESIASYTEYLRITGQSGD